jgi:hypothetical protein
MSSAIDGEGTHPGFLVELAKSKEAVWMVAQWLVGRGYNVRVNPSQESPTHAAWKDHTDVGDLEIHQRCEVKGLGYEFTGLRDWPHKDFIVCAAHSFDRAFPKPSFYFYTSKSKQTLVILDVKATSRTWRVEPRPDGRRGGAKQDFYICDPDQVTYFPLTEPPQ